MIYKGADDFNSGMLNATYGDHKDLVEFFISKGANSWQLSIEAADEQEHYDLVDFLQEKMDSL